MSDQFYSAKGLLETLDANGEKPELYIVCSRVRGPGKTFSLTKHLVDTFHETGDKFVLIARTRSETGSIADGMMKAMLDTVYPGTSAYEKIRMGGAYSDVFLRTLVPSDDAEKEDSFEEVHCGYVIALNAADVIKKVSSKFSDASHGFFDEFQPEHDDTYLHREVDKFLTVHGSVARGDGQSRKHFPIYMSSNSMDIANPYFEALGLTNKIQGDTNKFRGDGLVFQRAANQALVEKHAGTAMSRAFSGSKIIQYSDNSWINNNNAGIGRPDDWGRGQHLCALDDNGLRYGLYVYHDVDILYLSRKHDKEAKLVYRLQVDGESNLPMLRSSEVAMMIKKAIQRGAMRFQDQASKRLAMKFLAPRA